MITAPNKEALHTSSLGTLDPLGGGFTSPGPPALSQIIQVSGRRCASVGQMPTVNPFPKERGVAAAANDAMRVDILTEESKYLDNHDSP